MLPEPTPARRRVQRGSIVAGALLTARGCHGRPLRLVWRVTVATLRRVHGDAAGGSLPTLRRGGTLRDRRRALTGQQEPARRAARASPAPPPATPQDTGQTTTRRSRSAPIHAPSPYADPWLLKWLPTWFTNLVSPQASR